MSATIYHCSEKYPNCKCLVCSKGLLKECCELETHIAMDCPITECPDYEKEGELDAE